MKKLLTTLLLIAGLSCCTVYAESALEITLLEDSNDFFLQLGRGEYEEPYTSAEPLFDGEISTNWYGHGQWTSVIWEVPENISIIGYELVGASDSHDDPEHTPASWYLHGSHNYGHPIYGDGDWDILSDIPDNDTMRQENGAVCTVMFPEATPEYRYYQLEMYNLPPDGCCLAEIRLLTEETSPQTYDPIVISAVTSAIALAGYALTKKK